MYAHKLAQLVVAVIILALIVYLMGLDQSVLQTGGLALLSWWAACMLIMVTMGDKSKLA